MNSKKVLYVVYFILMITSIALLFVTVFSASRMVYIQENMTPIDSTIVIITYNNDDNVVIVEYTFNEVIYQVHSNYYSSTMRVGDTIKIYIDPENPANHYQPSIFSHVILPVFFALVCGGIGFPSFISLRKVGTLKKRLLGSGRKVIGTITDLQTNYSHSLTINNRRYYKSRITCKFVDEFSDMETIYKSHAFWDYVDDLVELGVSTIEVWVDPTNPQIYYVDQESIQKAPSNNFN